VTLTIEQQAALLGAVRETDLFVPVFLALATGLRRGELLGLAWPNVDLDAGLLRVVQTIEKTSAGARIKPQPKTTHGRRTVALTPGTVEVLRAHRVAQAEERDLLFPRWAGSPAVFGTALSRGCAYRDRVQHSRSPPHARHQLVGRWRAPEDRVRARRAQFDRVHAPALRARDPGDERRGDPGDRRRSAGARVAIG
jgi:integrase